MNPEQIVDAYLDALGAKDLARLSGFISPHLVFVTPLRPMSKEDLLAFFRALFAAFPDWRVERSPLSVSGNVVTTKLQMAGTHTATFVPPFSRFKPINATGKRVVLPSQEFVYHVQGEHIVRIVPEAVANGGMPELMRQIGARVPPLWLLKFISKVSALLRR
jgi:predicted ester cyclase